MQPVPADWLARETARLLQFGRRFPHPLGGAAWLRSDGTPDLDRPVHTWITARMTHVYSLADLLGVPGAGALADAGPAGLTGVLHDRRHGGWHPLVSAAGRPPAATHALGRRGSDRSSRRPAPVRARSGSTTGTTSDGTTCAGTTSTTPCRRR